MTISEQFWWLTPFISFLSLMAFLVLCCIKRQLAQKLATQRATTVAWIIDGIGDRAALRAGLTRRHAIDQVWLLMDPAVYLRLTRHRGWSPADYETWFTGTITRLLLD